MAHILFVTWDGGGNVPPAFGIAGELARRGHSTRFLGHRAQEPTLTAGGHGFTAYADAEDFVGARPASPVRLVRLFSDRGMARDLLAEVGRRPADLVVVDALLMGALDGAARSGLRYVPLQHCFDGYQRGAWLKGPVGTWGRVRRLRPVTRWNSAELALSTTLRELDPGARTAPANLCFSGPVVGAARPSGHGDRTVLVSLSTIHYSGMEQLLQRVVAATEGLDARVLVTTGAAIDPGALRVHDRVELHRFVPHGELMPEASLVVGHGGHGTAMRALAHDLPLLVLPVSPLLDHRMVGRAVTRAGAGRVLPPSSSSERLRSAVEELLADGPHRVAAARLGERIRCADGAVSAADALEELLTRPGRHLLDR